MLFGFCLGFGATFPLRAFTVMLLDGALQLCAKCVFPG
jgi:hypothetical protein